MKKFIVIQKRARGATQISAAHYEGERPTRIQKRVQLGILDADGHLMLKQGLSLDAATRRLLKAKGIAVSEQASPGRGRPKGSGTKTQEKSVAKALGNSAISMPVQGVEGWEVRETGRTAVLEKLAADSGLTKCLDGAFGEELAGTLLARSLFSVCECDPAYLAEAWQEEVVCSRDSGPLDSGSISELERSLGADDASRHAFISAWIEQLGKPSSLIIDSTSHSTEAKQIVDAEFGYNRDGERMAQVNLTMVLDRDQRLPLYYRTLPGSIPDVSSLCTTSELLRQLGLQNFSFVLDRGFHSHDNLVEMILAKQAFTIGVPLTGKQAQSFVAEHRASLENSQNSFVISGSLVYGAKHAWTLEDERLPEGKRDLDGWLFFDPERAQGQRKTIETKMLEFEAQAATKTFTSEAGAKKWVAEQAKGWTEYLEVEQLPDAPAPVKPPRKNAKPPQLQRFRVGRNHTAIEAQRPWLGITFVLATMAHPDALNALLAYRSRDALEKMFRCDKSFLDNLRMRVHSTSTMQGRLFVNFISLIIATLFENRLRDCGLLGKMSMAEALQQLRKVRRMDIPGQPSVALEIPKKAAAILTACGIGDAAATKPERKPARRRK
jgi:transposase